MRYRRSNTANQVEKQKSFGPPNAFQNPAKYPQGKHVEKNMHDTRMGKHVRKDLVGLEILIINRPQTQDPLQPMFSNISE